MERRHDQACDAEPFTAVSSCVARLRTTFRVVSLRRIFYRSRDHFTSTQGQSPPGEPQSSCAAHAEFVICDCTIKLTWRENNSELPFPRPRLCHYNPLTNILPLATLA